jgi:hypothetical protein
MVKLQWALTMTVLIGAGNLASLDSLGQTPEQQQMWDAQRAETAAADKLKAERLAHERELRRADPMAWVRTLNPMAAGGWQFRAVATDGAWADYSTDHQMKRSGRTVTAWLRQEYAELQVAGDNRYMSVVEKVQYDCAKQLQRPLVVVYYANNNIQGTETTEEADIKTAVWNAIVPGTRDEYNYLWACADKAPKS